MTSALDIAAAVSSRERSAREVVAAALDAAERTRDANAFLALDADGALARAEDVDRRVAAGESLALAGVPVALKANLCLEGAEITCGSRVLAGYRAPYTATAVARLLDAGAVPIGTANMDEFAMGSSGENSCAGPTTNPWSAAHAPGGSSSGSAAAVALDVVPLALGSDTGGSVRQPASLCGVTGFKPSYGRVSRYGLVAFGSSLDQIGPLARDARDAERCLEVVSGADRADATCVDAAPVVPEAGDTLDGLRVGVLRDQLERELGAGVRERVLEAAAQLERLGAELVDVSLPATDHAISTYYVLATAEASSNLARFDGVRFGARSDGDGSLQGMIAATRNAGFGREVKRRVLLGTYVLSAGYHDAWYGKAERVRALVARELDAAFERCDLLLGPTSPTTAFRLGDRTDDPVAMYLADTFTVPASLAGLPAVSVPAGLSPATGDEPALPVGLQLTGPRLADARVLRAARAFQSVTDWHLARPGAREGGPA